MQKLLTVKQLASLFSASPQLVYKMARTGNIPYRRIGKKAYRFDPDDIGRWLANQRHNSTTNTIAGFDNPESAKAHAEESETNK